MFHLGRVVATPAALEAIEKSRQEAMDFFRRHQRGDWGDVCRDDADANIQAVRYGMRILSVYRLHMNAVKIYIITEHDRSVTTLLLASEY